MTRLLTCGYETGDVAEAGTSVLGASGQITVVSSTPTPRAGAGCLKVTTTIGTFAATYKIFLLPASKTEVWVRFAVYLHPSSAGTTAVLAGVRDSAGGDQACLTWDPVAGTLTARRDISSAGTVLAASGTPLAAESWHVIEWRHQMISASSGTTEVWLDGNRVINFTGDNANTATANVQAVLLGSCSGSLSSATGIYFAFDDIAINDVAGSINNGRPGDGRIVLLTPNGAGSSTQLTRGGTDTGANYSQVNELPPSIAQYVGSATVAQRDLYAMSDIGIAVSSINVVEAIALAQNSDAGGGSIGLTIKSGATINEATAIGLSTSTGYVRSQWEVDPNTTAAWTIAAVNAAEAGATIR